MQIVYQIIAAYFEDDCSDELINDPVPGEDIIRACNENGIELIVPK